VTNFNSSHNFLENNLSLCNIAISGLINWTNSFSHIKLIYLDLIDKLREPNFNSIHIDEFCLIQEAYLNKILPNAKCELNYNKDYELLIATVLSAQTTDKRVNEVTKVLWKEYSSLYELKGLKKDNNINSKKALSVIKCIKIKIIAYFSSTFLMFLFFWYSASAFCAVYANTQRIFVADSYTSFLMGLLYPFILYLAPTALRVLSLKVKEKKNLKILYSLSDKIPFF